MTVTLPQLGWIETTSATDPQFNTKLAETLRTLMNSHNLVATKTGVSSTPLPPPPTIRSIAVTSANGYFSIAISDPVGAGQPNLGINYFVDWDVTAAFTNPLTIHLGPSRNGFVALGNQTTYWRAYSQYQNSPLSPKVLSANNPVTGGGSAGPTPPPSQGSGGNNGQGGFGAP